ncbi:hypothetical protein ABN764_25670 [Paenibacillaceae sp. P-4]|uniref:hypothetical protein n=1 Tax=Paenibacillaceae bacterium P-4 TaxID=3160969 RepID=UPI0032E830EE
MKLCRAKGFESEILLLTKFTQEKYVKSIVNGQLFMNNIKYFVDLENQTKVKGQGDRYEAANILSNVTFKMYLQGTDTLIGEGTAGQIIERNHVFDNIPIFCFTAFDSSDFKIIDETENSYKVVFDIASHEVDKMIADFGTKAILINPVSFINKVDEAFRKKGIEYQADKVKYEDLSVNRVEKIESYRVPTTTPLFTKDIYFKYQREFRIVLLNHRVEKSYIAEIGRLDEKRGLGDTAFHVMDTIEFFQNTLLDVVKRK